MSVDPAIFRAMVENGASSQELGDAIKAALLEEEAIRARRIPWAKLRAMAFDRDGYCCTYCGTTDAPFEIDHIKPRCKGGENILENVVVACRRCNRSKKDREAPNL